MQLSLTTFKPKEPEKCVVRVSTSYFTTNRGMSARKDINILKRKSDFCMVDMVKEDMSIDVKDFFNKIHNIMDVEDGVYELMIINPIHDCESGWLDDWEYTLVKLDEDQ